jgi:hypothetical protein
MTAKTARTTSRLAAALVETADGGTHDAVIPTFIDLDRRPEVRAKRASKGDGPGRSSFEGRASHGHLRTTVVMSHQ